MRSGGALALRCFALVAAVAACAPTPAEPRRPSRAQALDVDAAHPTPAITIELRSPARTRWISSTLGPSKPTLGVVVTNQDPTASADVSGLKVHLEAVREGVPFRCAESVGASDGAREPSSLGPRARHVFDRTLDCALPLTGSYAVRVSVSFGHGEWSTPHVVHTFALRVDAPDRVEPKPVVGVPGLWAGIGASQVLFGTKGTDGPGRIAVSLVNGGSAPVRPPPLALALRVYRAGSPIPCEDEPIPLHPAAALAPGDVHREPIDVSCLGLGTPGTYDVTARLRVGAAVEAPEVEIGRLRIEISGDPTHRTFLLPDPASPAK